MDLATRPDSAMSCAMPGCGATTSRADSIYIDGCGQVCRECVGPDPEWMDDIEPPF